MDPDIDDIRQRNDNAETDILMREKSKPAKKKDGKIEPTYAFKQQLLQAWRPKPTLKCTIIVYLVIGLIFLILGIVLLIYTQALNEVRKQYDVDCKGKEICSVEFDISKDMKAPVYVYYGIDGFYQNHRRYIKSIPYDQLRGNDLDKDSLGDCEPALYNKDFPHTVSADGIQPLEPDQIAIPCGVAARAFFNDTFTLFKDNSQINILDTGIAWETDIEHKFKNIDLNRQWIDMTNERFITWMKVAPFKNFRKSWGRITETDLNEGKYRVDIINNWDVSIFGGKKYFILSETNVFGGKNSFLAYSYIAVGVIAIILSMIFCLRKSKRPTYVENATANTGMMRDEVD